MAPHKLTLICPNWPPRHDGIGDYTHRLSEELVPLLGQVQVIVSESPTPLIPDTPGLKVLPIASDWRSLDARKVAKEARSTAAEIYHIQFPDTKRPNQVCLGMLSILLRLGGPCRVVTTFHNFGAKTD